MNTGANRVDALVVAAKGTLGAIPVVGPIVAEVVGAIIPNQRIDRLTRLVDALRSRVVDLDQALIETRMKTPEGVDLLEDAFQQAARALSDERLEYIADVLKHGISEDKAKQSEAKFLLWILGQLSDAEVILLAWYDMLPQPNDEFEARHRHIIEPPAAHLGSPQEEIDAEALHNARVAHLVSLGLFRPRFRHVWRGEFPEFDDRTGMMKASGYDVTSLGRLLLRTINPK